MADFTPCLAFVLAREGGYTADPLDTGNWTGGATGSGELKGTKYGLSAAAWYGKTSQWPPTLDDAHAIYRTEYWDRICGDQLPAGVALMVMDHAVNCGVSASARLLQDAVATRPDGVIGPVTIAETAKRSPGLVIAALAEAQEIAYENMFGFPRFGKGWLDRLDLRREEAMSMLTPSSAPAPAPAPAPKSSVMTIFSALTGIFSRKAA